MKNAPSPSKSARFRDSLHQYLQMYALAASATGVSVLALMQPGEAEIVYTPANVTLQPNQQYGLDLSQDGTVDFIIKNHACYTTSGYLANIFVQHPGGNAVAAHRANAGFPWAYALRSGMPITKRDRQFTPGRATMMWSYFFLTTVFREGSWFGASNQGISDRYLGLKFKIDGENHYGWARLSVGISDYVWVATLTGYAYETIPNKTIKAGAEQGDDADEGVQQTDPAALTKPAGPATLGLLAKGSSALSTWRRNAVHMCHEE